MELRKVQMTGGSSYVISLPKDWIKKNNIHKNDPLALQVQSDGTLLVSTRLDGEPVRRSRTFTVSGTDDPTYLFRCLIGAYIMGFTSIEITSQGRMPAFVRQVVRDFTQMTIGQEVETETETSITIRDLLNPAEITFDNTIRRMYVIVKGMHADAIDALCSGSREIAEDVIERDRDVDRLNWLIARQYHLLLTTPGLSRKLGLSAQDASGYFQIARTIERIGDHAVRIAQYSLNLIDGEIDPDLLSRIQWTHEVSLEIFDRSIQAFWKHDLSATNAIIVSVHRLTRQCEDITATTTHLEGIIAISIGYVVESIGRMGEYGEDIAETIINHEIGST